MSLVPNLSADVLAKAKQVWEESIDFYGSEIQLENADGSDTKTVKAFAKRPKIMGLFDRTQDSYDQEKYVLIVKAISFDSNILPEKFVRARWDNEDHMFISVTKVEISNVVFGYRILVKG
jgi:hypothetical protein